MPIETEECYTSEVLEAFEQEIVWEQEEISYEQHIDRMDMIRDERRDRVYPAPPRDRVITEPTRDFRGRTLHDAYLEATAISTARDSCTVYDEPEFDDPEPIVAKFKVGDKVLLDPRKIPLDEFGIYCSSGTIGDKYIITEVLDRGAYITYYLNGSNYHKEEWLTLVPKKNLIGGELL